MATDRRSPALTRDSAGALSRDNVRRLMAAEKKVLADGDHGRYGVVLPGSTSLGAAHPSCLDSLTPGPKRPFFWPQG